MFTRYDILLIVGLLVAGIVTLGVMRYTANAVDTMVIKVDGEEVIRAPLANDGRFSVEGPLGKMEIEIKDRRVRVVDAPCGRKICVQTGWIHKPYQTIICMPNHVVTGLTGKGNNELDGITG